MWYLHEREKKEIPQPAYISKITKKNTNLKQYTKNKTNYQQNSQERKEEEKAYL